MSGWWPLTPCDPMARNRARDAQGLMEEGSARLISEPFPDSHLTPPPLHPLSGMLKRSYYWMPEPKVWACPATLEERQ